MGETEVHVQCLIDSREALRDYYHAHEQVYIGANMLLYYQEGEPRLSVAPDVFVVHGVPKLPPRRTYKVWEEGKAPDWMLEITSRSTQGEDLGVKRGLYEWLGVREYFLFDPLGEYLAPRLQGFSLVQGRYEPITPTASSGLPSQVLGLELRVRDGRLRLYHPATATWLLTPEEQAAARRAAEARAAAASEAQRAAAEAELARLRAELQRRMGEP